MALTYTPQAKTDEVMPNFQLSQVDGSIWSSEILKDTPAAVVVFMCNHCPYVQAIEDRLILLARELKAVGVPFVGICSNDPRDYPEDSTQELFKRWKEKNYGFTYLVDETQEVARKFGAVCTPDFFVYDAQKRLSFRGRLDDSWKDATKVQKRELWLAVQSIMKGEKPTHERPSMGCSIKWSKT